MKSLLPKAFWLLLAAAHAFFLGRFVGEVDFAAVGLGDILRLGGLLAAIVWLLAEASGCGFMRFVHVPDDPRRIVAFWAMVVLTHAAVPFRADASAASDLATPAAATYLLFVLPATALAAIAPLLLLVRRAVDTTARRSARSLAPRLLDRLHYELCLASHTLPRDFEFLRARLALAPPFAA